MMVVCFGDGLGNQMFQYAFYLALKNCYPENDIYGDIFRIYGGEIHNGFELNNVFNINIKECSKGVSFSLSDYFPLHQKRYKILNMISGMRRRFHGYKESFIIQDDPTGFYEEVFHLSSIKSYMFCGNWVNPKYFEKYKKEVVNSFSFKDFKSHHNLKYEESIKASNSVSVHIRRGDYLKSGMSMLSVDYYRRAKSIIDEQVKDASYYIFTDDKNDIKDYLELFEKYIIVEGNKGQDSYRDMQLMTLCRHNIIANSTFSFWGAYLNKNVNSIVVAPAVAKPEFRHPFACDEWIIIPN